MGAGGMMREKLKMARPYVRALIKDEKAREHH